ncbi:MAG: carbon starvation protein A [Phycisphaeraceae bacterium]|nr:carbon starvation protein A [Phycisphaeraceae bacterium]
MRSLTIPSPPVDPALTLASGPAFQLPLIAFGVLALLAVGYLVYGSFIARRFNLDDRRVTPANARNDGIDFVPARPFYLLGQHFSAISAAGPIIGPVLACMAFGWGPCLLWIVLGVIFIGAVHDFSALVASVRHGAHSIADVARTHLGRRASLALVAFIWLALIYVIVAFTDVTARAFVGDADELRALTAAREALSAGQPAADASAPAFHVGGAVAGASTFYLLLALLMGAVQRFLRPPMWLSTIVFVPATLAVIYGSTAVSHWFVLDQRSWSLIILAYCFAASMLPLWLLQQPRGYLGGFVLYLAIAVGVLGVLLGGFEVRQPAFRPIADYGAFFSAPTADGRTPPRMTDLVFPFLFVTIACGACSGFHGLVCGGTTSRQIDKESHCKPIAFGAMLLEGFVAVIALTTVMILSRDDLARYAGKPGAIYGDGLAAYICAVLGLDASEGSRALAVARTFGQMAVATFIFDTLDVATRLGRYLIQEFTGKRSRAFGVLAAALTAGIPALIILAAPSGSYLLFWTLFGTSNQLLAALTLTGVCVWLIRSRRNARVWYVALPAAFVMLITTCALGIQVFVGAKDAFAMKWSIVEAVEGGNAGETRRLNPTILNAAVALALFALAAFFCAEARRALRSAPPAPAESPNA